MAPISASERQRRSNGNVFPPFISSAGRSVHSLTANVLSHLYLPHPPSFPGRPAAASTKAFLPLHPGGSTGSYCRHSRSQGSASTPPPSSSSSSAVSSFGSGERIEGPVSISKSKEGPVFVGQVFSMIDPSGNGLMSVTTRFNIPFFPKSIPVWIKKMFATVINTNQKGPVFHFFMDLSDAVSYVKRLNVRPGTVGSCRLDVAYEYFKGDPNMFQFVPNQKQVKAANKLLKQLPRERRKRKVHGVPVFSARNLNIAIASNDGLKWYTPYFFDKTFLDDILEVSTDQHFHTLIQIRHVQRRRDIIDDNLSTDAIEEYNDSLLDPPEVQEMMDEMGQYGIPLSFISKAAEIYLLDTVDKMLLGNKWLRKAIGIQPKFPYLVESFEERSTSSYARSLLASAAIADDSEKERHDLQFDAPELGAESADDNLQGLHAESSSQTNSKFPFPNLFQNPWARQQQKQKNFGNHMKPGSRSECDTMKESLMNPLLPKITMVGISMVDGQMNRENLKKTVDDLSKELDQAGHDPKLFEEMDPLFIGNVGDYSSIPRLSYS